MSIVPPPIPVHTVEESSNKLKITIYGRKNWMHTFRLFMSVIWAGISMVGFGYIDLVFFAMSLGMMGFQHATDLSFLVPVSLASAAYFFGFVGCVLWFISNLISFLRHIAGQEIIEMTNRSIKVINRVLSYSQSKEYLLEHLSNLRIVQPDYGRRGSIVSRIISTFVESIFGLDGWIAFDYGPRTFRFACEVEEAEAKQILATIQEHLPQHQTKS